LVAEAREGRRFAAEKLSAALARRRGDAEAWRTLAGVKGAGGNQADAVAAARAAVVLSPESEASQARLCLESRQAGDPETALLAADALVKMSPTAVQHWLARAEIHISRRDWPKADSDARAALAIQPLHWKGHLYLGVCRHHRGDSAAARQERATAARLIPSDQLRAAYLHWFSEQTR
jgi:tetratricopeptide (TPR) repeat protein